MNRMAGLNMDDSKKPVKPQLPRTNITYDDELDNESFMCTAARESIEHHASSSDLMSHLHGNTPVPRRFHGRPPRLSMQSINSTASKGIVAASPFPISCPSLPSPIEFQGDFVST
jgi:hypothetical protein